VARQVLGVLQAVVYAVLVHVGEVEAILFGRPDQLPPELCPLLGRHLREDVLGRLLVDVWRKVRGHLLVACRRLLSRYRPRPLLVAIHEVLVLLLRTAEQPLSEVHINAPGLVFAFRAIRTHIRSKPRTVSRSLLRTAQPDPGKVRRCLAQPRIAG
jgi:hypothetical protein